MEVEEEVTQVKKTRVIPLKTEGGVANEQSPQTIQQWFEEEARMSNSDKQIHEILRKKNELESLVYELRQNVSGSHEQYLDDTLRQTIQSQCDQDEDWLYGEGEDTTKSAYQTKLDHLVKLSKPVYQRY